MRKSVEIPGPPPRLPARVISLRPHAGGLFTLTLDAGAFPFTPGDCVAVYAPDGKTTRPYSLAGAAVAAHLELLIRRIPGGTLSGWLAGLHAGDVLEISPPFGWFRPGHPAEARKVWFATGSGIAPFLSALRSGARPPERFLWGVRTAADLDGIDAPGVVPCISRGPGANGRVTDRLDGVPIGPDIRYALCGLDAMIEEVAAWLEERGVGAGQIQRECFFTAPSG